MKKKYIIYIIIILNISFLSAQITTVVDGIDESNRLHLEGNILYYTAENSSIYYIDITEANPSPTLLITGLGNPVGMAIKDDFMYVALFDDEIIVKINITQSNPSPVTVSISGTAPNMLEIYGNYLYYTDNDFGVVYKYDLAGNSNTATPFITGYPGAISIDIKDDFLYFGQTTQGKMHKIDLSDPNSNPVQILSGISSPIGMEFYGDDLYIASRNVGKIIKINPFEDPIVVEDVVTGLSLPADITFDGNIMYISEFTRISKIDLSLSVGEFLDNSLLIFPNPVNDYLQISSTENKLDFHIYDTRGRVLKSGTVLPNNRINVSNLSQGNYYLKLDNEFSSVVKNFVKQ